MFVRDARVTRANVNPQANKVIAYDMRYVVENGYASYAEDSVCSHMLEFPTLYLSCARTHPRISSFPQLVQLQLNNN